MNRAKIRWFVFGHTHRQGKTEIEGASPVAIYNVGSCYDDRGKPITFLQLDVHDGGSPCVRLMFVDAEGQVSE